MYIRSLASLSTPLNPFVNIYCTLEFSACTVVFQFHETLTERKKFLVQRMNRSIGYSVNKYEDHDLFVCLFEPFCIIHVPIGVRKLLLVQSRMRVYQHGTTKKI